MTRQQAETFYAVHSARPFGELVDFMTSGPVVVQVLQGDNAGPLSRSDGCDRSGQGSRGHYSGQLYAQSIGVYFVHGSDAAETAAVEIAQFFSGNEIVGDPDRVAALRLRLLF